MTPPIYISFLKKVRQKGLLFGSTFLKGGTKKCQSFGSTFLKGG
jgi:hypothetical protein